jgi:predicted Zn-dependent protease
MEARIFHALEDGLSRIQRTKHIFREPSGQRVTYKPFFSSIQLVKTSDQTIEVENGGLLNRKRVEEPHYAGRVEVRIGDYERGGSVGSKSFVFSRDLELASSKNNLWVASNDAFWAAIEDYMSRNLSAVGIKNAREKYVYFARTLSGIDLNPTINPDVRFEEVEENLKRASKKVLEGNKRILFSNFDFSIDNTHRYLVNSEGSKISSGFIRYQLSINLSAIDDHNLIIPHRETIYALNSKEIPSLEKMIEIGEKVSKELSDIIKSPVQKNGEYPVILDPENHGVLWHEVIGHALEGHRMQDDEDDEYWGDNKVSLFLGKIGQKVAPKFISLYDDPTLPDTDGFYKYDDEGTLAQKVQLIENGVLRNYLHSRASAAFFKTASNGHARASGTNDPVARMSNIVVKSSNEVSFEQLKENLLMEVKKRNEEYGLLFYDCNGGLTLPENSQFETYPSRVYRIHKNGKVEQVRGVYIVGTPYQTMRHIVQTSNEYGTFRGHCGAESGWVPSTETAPHALIKSLEINRIPASSYDQIKKMVVPKPGE